MSKRSNILRHSLPIGFILSFLLLAGAVWFSAQRLGMFSTTTTPTPTSAPTLANTPTSSPTATATATSTATHTPTATPTSTATPTPFPTDTATPSPTPSPTLTFTPTPTQTATPLPTPTATLSPTALASPTPMPPPTASITPTAIASPTPLPPATATALPTEPASTEPAPTATTAPAPQQAEFLPPAGRQFATLEDFWNGNAEWLLEEYNTGLPVGESDTIYRGGNEFWSYLHASHQSAGVVDQCGDPVPFPGCTTLWKSFDGGRHFSLDPPICLFPCAACPCDHGRDHIGQQQYPRVFFMPDQAYLVYEFGAYTFMRTSTDGLNWSASVHVPGTGIWHLDQAPCGVAEEIGEHPHIYSELEWDCLAGAPPGIYVEGNQLYVFIGLGRAPGHMGCLVGNRYSGARGLRNCVSNPLFGAEHGYGPVEVLGPEANPYFEFRTISSADVVRVGEHYYMTYEGVRGPSDPTVVDDQFALGLARSVGLAIDGPWEKYPGNPIITDLPGNVGLGHADIVMIDNATYLYTATSHSTRGRYVLVRR